MKSVAIIGGGISGICSAKSCLEQGLLVTIFESRPVLGGLWSRHDTPVFENLTTNTSVYETVISDIPPRRMTPSPHLGPDSLCYTRDEMYEYVQYVLDTTPGIRELARLSTKVQHIKRCDGKFQVSFKAINADGMVTTEIYDRVIIASGNFAEPIFPPAEELPGIDKYAHKISHVAEYQLPSQMRDKRVLIVGGSVSGCEAAGDLANSIPDDGPKSVTLSSRTMRYLISKQVGTRLIASVISTRFHYLRSLAGRYGDEEFTKDLQKEFQNFTNSDFGAPEPSGPIKRPFIPGFMLVNPKLLNASKTGRMEWKIGGLKRITETGAEFLDGSEGAYDKIIFATGYHWDFSFLEEDVLSKIATPGNRLLNLYDFSFHPELENLAFVGIFPLGSAAPPMLDAQARWVARVFSGELKPVGKETMWAGIEAYQKHQQSPESRYLVYGYESMDRFARHGGFDVNLGTYPELVKGLIFSPLVPSQFRMFGHGKTEKAIDECVRQLKATGFKIGDRRISEEEMEELHEILNVLENREDCPKGLREAVECLTCE